jgi:16S rRNA (cytosine967-C5)-methyltransferase
VSRYHSYLNSSREILSLYNGEEPFASFVKKYFSGNKKYGSRDRKEIARLCYCYFRASPHSKGMISKSLIPDELKLLKSLFLCSTEPNEILASLKPEWNDSVQLSINEKLFLLTYQLSSVFPYEEELSEGIEYEKFCASFFSQPDLFLRIRPGNAEKVLLQLNEAGVDYEFISPFTIRLPNSFKANTYFELDKEVVVQDYNSQKVIQFLPVRPGRSDKLWDCCSGSGGKSIMAFDLNPAIDLFVSDVRESILVNLKKRFEKAGINKYKSFTLDLSKENFPQLPTGQAGSIISDQYSIIIADVPCTGSGTWGRTPEQLFFFDTRKIDEYAAMQKKIVSNVIPHLLPGGYLLYITCSVFKKENEEMVNYLKEKFHLEVLKMELLEGYQMKADTMFAALLKKPL